MTDQDLVDYLRSLNLSVSAREAGGNKYIVIRDYPVPCGSLRGQLRDVAVMWSGQVPYVLHSSVHFRPNVVTMGSANSQASPLGQDWQYLSRVLRGQPSPQRILTHINTVLSEF